MRRFPALAVIFALVLAAGGNLVNSGALAAEPHNSELWHIATINDPANKKFTYCAAESSFDNGFSLAFARNRALNTNVVVTFPHTALEEHTKFRMGLVVDGAAPRDFVGFSANPQTLVIPLQHDRAIVDSLQKGKLLEVRGPKDSIKFALDGANDALRRLQLCVETNLKAEAASAGGMPEARPLVLGGPAAVDAAPTGDVVEPLPLPSAPATPPPVELAQADQAKPAETPTNLVAAPPAQPPETAPEAVKIPLDNAAPPPAQQAQLDAQRQAADEAAAKQALARLDAAEAAKKAAAQQAAKDEAAQQQAAQDAQAAEAAKQAAAQQAAKEAAKQKAEQDAQAAAAAQAAAKVEAAKEAAARAEQARQQAQLDAQHQAADEAAAKQALARLDAAETAKKAAAEQEAQQVAAQQKAAQQKAEQDAAMAEAARKAAAEQAAARAAPPKPVQATVSAPPTLATRPASLGSLLQDAGVPANTVKGHEGAYSWKTGTIAGSASETRARQPFLDAMLDNIDALEKACKGPFSSSIGAPATRGGATYAEVATKCGPVPGVRLYYEKAGRFGIIAQESAEADRDNAVTIRQRVEGGLIQAMNNQ